MALVGAGIMLISSLLNWIDLDGFTENAYNVPAVFLLDYDNDGGPGVGLLLIALTAAVVVGVFVAQVRWLSIVGGAVAIIVGLLYIFQVNRGLDDVGPFAPSLGDFIGIGQYLAIVGGIVALAGGAMAIAQRR